jgi:PIN domain nuclease of toxin-antitoxin system
MYKYRLWVRISATQTADTYIWASNDYQAKTLGEAQYGVGNVLAYLAPGVAVLLDTHALVWLVQGNERLGTPARAAIEASTKGPVRVNVAALSNWEIGKLVAEARLTLDRDIGEWIKAALSLPGMGRVELEPEIAVAAPRSPGKIHDDPADRLTVASSRHMGPVLISAGVPREVALGLQMPLTSERVWGALQARRPHSTAA